MFQNAKVGDKVWSIRFGWGKIIRIDEDSKYPIKVSFKTGADYNHCYDGKYYTEDVMPTLFWDEIKFEIPLQPKRKIEKKAYLNIYKGIDNLTIPGPWLYSSYDAAIKNLDDEDYISTVKIEWIEEE